MIQHNYTAFTNKSTHRSQFIKVKHLIKSCRGPQSSYIYFYIYKLSSFSFPTPSTLRSLLPSSHVYTANAAIPQTPPKHSQLNSPTSNIITLQTHPTAPTLSTHLRSTPSRRGPRPILSSHPRTDPPRKPRPDGPSGASAIGRSLRAMPDEFKRCNCAA